MAELNIRFEFTNWDKVIKYAEIISKFLASTPLENLKEKRKINDNTGK